MGIIVLIVDHQRGGFGSPNGSHTRRVLSFSLLIASFRSWPSVPAHALHRFRHFGLHEHALVNDEQPHSRQDTMESFQPTQLKTRPLSLNFRLLHITYMGRSAWARMGRDRGPCASHHGGAAPSFLCAGPAATTGPPKSFERIASCPRSPASALRRPAFRRKPGSTDFVGSQLMIPESAK